MVPLDLSIFERSDPAPLGHLDPLSLLLTIDNGTSSLEHIVQQTILVVPDQLFISVDGNSTDGDEGMGRVGFTLRNDPGENRVDPRGVFTVFQQENTRSREDRVES